MKFSIVVIVGLAGSATAAPFAKRDSVYGFDISHYQYVCRQAKSSGFVS